MTQHKPWKILETEELIKAPFFRMRKDRCQMPDGRIMPGYYTFEFSDWVNVVPVTSDGNMVLVRQYRHAAESVELEIPGGSLHGNQENPQIAGQRELKEETGFESSNWTYLGYHHPNPALQNNKMHTFLALDCQQTSPPNLDPYEDLTTEVLSVQTVFESLFAGKIQHSIIMASLVLALPHLNNWVSIPSRPK